MSSFERALEIIKRLRNKGFQAFIVGGAARDLYMDLKPDDYDIATNASHLEVKEIFRDKKTAIVGISFKICLVDGIEIANYRSESNIINPTIEDDLKRRDFTINSLAYDPVSEKIIDISTGIEDIKNRIIRFNGSAKKRIEEDPLRIVRACRFLAKLKGKFYKNTLKELSNHSSKLREIAPERLKSELLKSMDTEYPSIFFNALHQTGALKYVSPEFERTYGLDGGPFHDETIAEHINMTGNFLSKRKPLLRLAGFFHDHGKADSMEYKNCGSISFYDHENIGARKVEKELKDLKFSIKETDYVKNLVKFHMRDINSDSSEKSVRKLIRDLSDHSVNWKDWLLLKISDRHGNLKKPDYSNAEIRNIVFKFHKQLKPVASKPVFSINDLEIDGNDLIEIFNIKPGRRLGNLLNLALDYVLENPLNNEKQTLLKYLNVHINQTEVDGLDKKI